MVVNFIFNPGCSLTPAPPLPLNLSKLSLYYNLSLASRGSGKQVYLILVIFSTGLSIHKIIKYLNKCRLLEVFYIQVPSFRITLHNEDN